jgi:hypothetical protein
MGENSLNFASEQGPWEAHGTLISRGKRLLWDLNLRPALQNGETTATSWIPLSLHQGKLTRNRAVTLGSDWKAKGFCQVEGERWDFDQTPTEVVHEYGSSLPVTWNWGHCANFVAEDGSPAEDVLFEGCSYQLRSSVGIHLPRISTFAVRYRGEMIRINHLWESLRSRADSGHHHWKFQFDHGELSFRGEFHAESRDFAGITDEDTDGALKHVATSMLAKLTLRVYRRAQLEKTLHSAGGASLEFGTRAKNPYIRDLF